MWLLKTPFLGMREILSVTMRGSCHLRGLKMYSHCWKKYIYISLIHVINLLISICKLSNRSKNLLAIKHWEYLKKWQNQSKSEQLKANHSMRNEK